MLYLDSSALLKRYVEEEQSEACERSMLADPAWSTARHTFVEVQRNLHRLLRSEALREARQLFEHDWSRMDIVELDATLCERAAELA